MRFESLLDLLLGDREIIEEIECLSCNHNETYFMHPITKKTIGRACKTCEFIQRIED